jgi:hypothetical protein
MSRREDDLLDEFVVLEVFDDFTKLADSPDGPPYGVRSSSQ